MMKMKDIYIVLMLMVCESIYATDEKIIGFAQPDDPNACVPAIVYHSPYQDYKPQGAIKLQSWIKANESVKNQPMHHMYHMQHMNMPMEGSSSDMKEGTQHSNHQMKESK